MAIERFRRADQACDGGRRAWVGSGKSGVDDSDSQPKGKEERKDESQWRSVGHQVASDLVKK